MAVASMTPASLFGVGSPPQHRASRVTLGKLLKFSLRRLPGQRRGVSEGTCLLELTALIGGKCPTPTTGSGSVRRNDRRFPHLNARLPPSERAGAGLGRGAHGASASGWNRAAASVTSLPFSGTGSRGMSQGRKERA